MATINDIQNFLNATLQLLNTTCSMRHHRFSHHVQLAHLRTHKRKEANNYVIFHSTNRAQGGSIGGSLEIGTYYKLRAYPIRSLLHTISPQASAAYPDNFRTFSPSELNIAVLMVIKLNPYFLFVHYSGEVRWVNNFPNRCVAI